jgi:5-methylcytosine-specific restriction protein A
MVLFWDERWWVSSCSPCHSGFKQRVELMGATAIDRLADQLQLPRRAA